MTTINSQKRSTISLGSWKIPSLILLMGMIPSIPGAFTLVGLILGENATGIAHDFVSTHYFERPLPISLHIATGILFSIIAPFQFITKLRMKWPHVHRYAGRVAGVSLLVFSLTGLFLLGPLPAGSEMISYLGLGFSGVATAIAVLLSWRAAFQRRIPMHQLWMYRAIAIALAGGTRLVLEIFAYLIFAEITPPVDGAIMWLGLSINLAVVERTWRRKKTLRR